MAERRLKAELLSGAALSAATAWARARALEQALLLADLTQLADDCLPVGILDGPRVRGLACCYTGLPFLAISIWSEEPGVARAMLDLLAAHQPRLRREPAYALVAEGIYRQLAAVAEVEEGQVEVKSVLASGGPAPPSPAASHWQTVPLGPRDFPALHDLYRSVPAMAWTPATLSYGPCRGIYLGGELAAAAGVHFSTPWVSEIGHVVTRPEHRGQGMAEAVIRALVADLRGRTGHVFLMHFADNPGAGRLYERVGFVPYQRLVLTRFRIGSEATDSGWAFPKPAAPTDGAPAGARPEALAP